MSILIRGMEMPTSCDKCVYSAWSNFYQIYVCDAVRKNDPVLFDGKQTKSTAVARSARADNCPLVPVPAHGRLIDADALDNTLGIEDRDGWLRWTLEDAPTIIPADTEKEER